MDNYRNSVFLPETSFSVRPTGDETDLIKRWQNLQIYQQLRDKGKADSRQPFVLHDGPPYANGHLHVGHAVNKVLKDMVVRSQQMMGKDARFVPGWDCHGLPIEWKVEEQYRNQGLDKDQVDTVSFRQECRKFAQGWVDIQSDEFQRFGVQANWDNPYLTMDYYAESVIAEEFMIFLMNGSLYQRTKPVMWSPVEQTALAEAEVEYLDHTSHQLWVAFKVVGPNTVTELDGSGLDNAAVVIWTTTPWTLPQNQAVAFNPEISYSVYEVISSPQDSKIDIGSRYLVADKLAAQTFASAKLEMAMVRRLCGVTPEVLKDLTLAHPFRSIENGNGEWDYDVPMLPGDHVTDDAGTGFVHTAPSHGDDDYILGLKFGLPMTYNVEPDGSYRADLPLFGGQHIILPDGKEGPANVSVIKQLAYSGALFAKAKLKHSYPHSWRSKAPLIYRNTPQWFVAIDKPLDDGRDEYGASIRRRALTNINYRVDWPSQSGRNRLHSMIANRPDWVLSRQRAWGVPLTCFVKKGAKPTDSDFLLRDLAVNARIVSAFEAEGADAWYVEGFKERVFGDEYNPQDYEQIFDVLDVWFDSGSTHAFVLRDRVDGNAIGQADLYLEGTDQHRGWFQSSLLQACGTTGQAPYKQVVTHGFALDGNGIKMSKSVGNVITPQEVIDEYNADVLRLWVAQSDYTADLRISKEILKGVGDSYRKLRNTLKFLLGVTANFKSQEATMEYKQLPDLEKWVLHQLWKLDGEVRAAYSDYNFQLVVQKILKFCSNDLSSLYFDIRKDSLYCDGVNSVERRAARYVMNTVLNHLVSWLAPVLPFTTEEAWLARYPNDDDSVHLHDFPQVNPQWENATVAVMWDQIWQVRKVVTAQIEVERAAKHIGSSLGALAMISVGDEKTYQLLKSVNMAQICIVSDYFVILDDDLVNLPALVLVAQAMGKKCERCWQFSFNVNTHDHPHTCKRCDEVLFEQSIMSTDSYYN